MQKFGVDPISIGQVMRAISLSKGENLTSLGTQHYSKSLNLIFNHNHLIHTRVNLLTIPYPSNWGHTFTTYRDAAQARVWYGVRERKTQFF